MEACVQARKGLGSRHVRPYTTYDLFSVLCNQNGNRRIYRANCVLETAVAFIWFHQSWKGGAHA
jgi:hypothetical protein